MCIWTHARAYTHTIRKRIKVACEKLAATIDRSRIWASEFSRLKSIFHIYSYSYSRDIRTILPV